MLAIDRILSSAAAAAANYDDAAVRRLSKNVFDIVFPHYSPACTDRLHAVYTSRCPSVDRNPIDGSAPTTTGRRSTVCRWVGDCYSIHAIARV